MKTLTVKEPLLELNRSLGEGCIWDTRSQRLHFVDIDTNRLYTLDPKTGKFGWEEFEISLSALALMKDGSGFIASTATGFAFIPSTSVPFPPTSNSTKESNKPRSVIPIPSTKLGPKEQRMNDGACDPSGRFLAGTMGYEQGTRDGRLFCLQGADGSGAGEGGGGAKVVLEGITCTNGMGWSPDGKTMYFTDSWVPEIAAFNYDPTTGQISNRRTFFTAPREEYGEPDGMCMDSLGGIWSARWMCGKVIRLSPEGEVDVVVDFPTGWHMTNCVFGGENLDELYVTSAASTYYGPQGRVDRPDGGSLFVVKGLEYTGVERARFKGRMPVI